MFRLLLSLIIVFSTAFAQGQDSGGEDPSVIQKYGPRRQISTIVYMGLAGAILGLSTLSFYGRPQDKLTNIPIGFGVGVVIGTVYMTYQAATNPNEFYREGRLDPNWQQKPMPPVAMVSDQFRPPEKPSFTYQWQF